MFGIGYFCVGSWDTVHASSPPWSTSPPRRIDRILLFQLGLRVRRLSLPTTPGPTASPTWPAVEPHTLPAQAMRPCFPPPPPHCVSVLPLRPRTRTFALLTAWCKPTPQSPVRSCPAFRDPLAADHHPGLISHLRLTNYLMMRSWQAWLFISAVGFR